MLAKLAWVNGHLAALTAPERFVLEAIVATPSAIPVARVIPRAVSGLSFGLGRPEFEISGALAGLQNSGVLHWDNASGIALISELFRSPAHWCQSPNHLRGWFYGWRVLPRNSALTYAALVAVRKLVPLATETAPFARAWMETFARPLYEYLRWGGLDEATARRFAGVVTKQEIAALPPAVASNVRRQAEFKRRKRGILPDRALDLEHTLVLPADWRSGIAPRFAVSGAAAVPSVADRNLGEGSAHPGVANALGEATREGRLLGGVGSSREPVRSVDVERERDLDLNGLSLYLQKRGNDWVTTDGASPPNANGAAESTCSSSSGRSAEVGNDWVTTAEVTTESRLAQSLPSRYFPRAGGSSETQEGNNSKHGKSSGPWAGKSETASGVRPKHRVKIPWERFISDPKRARQFAELDERYSEGYYPSAGAQQAGGAGARREGRRPRGVVAAPSAGALAALSGWPKPK